MQICTIGFSKKSLREFINRLKKNNIKTVIDIRLNNTSQLAGYAKKDDLLFVLELVGIGYEHHPELAPTEIVLKDYKNKKISWQEYEEQFLELLRKRKPQINIIENNDSNICLLCSEDKPVCCHRRLVAEYYQAKLGNVVINHL